MAPTNTLQSFEALPFDIHYELTRFLDFESALNLASTNRHFHQVINPRTILPKEECKDFVSRRDVVEVNWTKDLFACYQCFRFLPRDKFVRKSTADRKKARHGKLTTQQRERACFDCAARYRLYEHLRPISNGKLRYYFCHNCGQYKTKSARCKGPRLGDAATGSGALVVCKAKQTRTPNGLEALPVHLLKKITSLLDFYDALRLQAASHHLHDTILPTNWVPLHRRYRFVHDKWHSETYDTPPEDVKTHPCYTCCRVRPRAKFTSLQLEKALKHPETRWKMRCHSCVERLHRGSRNPARVEYKRRLMCEICKCVKLGGRTCGGCLELYWKGGIDRRTMFPVRDGLEAFDYADLVWDYDGIFEDGGFKVDV